MNKVKHVLSCIWKHNKVWLFVTTSVLAFLLVASLIVTQVTFLSNTVSTVLGRQRRVLVSGDPSKYQYYTADDKDFIYFDANLDYSGMSDKKAKEATLEAANRLNEKIAEEGIVLLKNKNNALPLETSAQSKKKVSVFGKNSVNLVYGGSGSGGGDSDSAATIYDSLTAANFEFNPKLKQFYESSASGSGRSSNPKMGDIPMGLTTGETEQSKYTSDVKSSYSQYKDAAIVVISRIGGEGFDLPRTMLDSNGKTLAGSNEGDHYLQLDNNEKALLEAVKAENFGAVILVVNSSTSMELGFIDEDKYGIDAALWIGSPGSTGINALGRVLNGSVNPSGRLVDTYARDFKLNPTWENFSNNRVVESGNTPRGNQYILGGKGADAYFVEYEEGIYIGYRYYETRGYDEATTYASPEWYDNNVVYPFGYGLSYTQFDWEIIDRSPVQASRLTKDGEIKITVRVTNNGTKSGKDVVQLYYSAPYQYGQIEKPIVALAAFEKTGEIAPTEYEDVTLTLKVSDMASYDYNDANNNGFKGYEAEAGIYSLVAAKNANDAWRDAETGEAHNFQTELCTRYMIPSENGVGFIYNNAENRFDDVSAHFTDDGGNAKNLLTRSNFDGSMPKAPTVEERSVDVEFINSLKYTVNDTDKPWQSSENYTQSTVSAEGKLHLYDMITYDETTGKFSVDYNDVRWERLINQMSISEMAYLIGTGNFNTAAMSSIDKPGTIDPDGPAGFTNFMGDPSVYGTCFYASECVIGATWNKKLVHDMGVMVGLEGMWGYVKGDGTPYSGWYAPAVNIHRSPFSGRNFEYYSEDGYLAGMLGANVVKGAKSKGVYTYVKHFALNDQETDRVSNGLITWADEQTMREVYLKPFEIIVKEGNTSAIMSSFNRLGTTWAGGSYALLTQVLREEWGFKGTVISDYNLYEYMPADQMIRAGGDLNLTQNSQPSTSSSALTSTQIAAMRRATKNILFTVASSNAMNGYGEGVVYRYAIPMWQVVLIIVDCAAVVAFGIWGFFAIKKSLKKENEVQ